MEGDRSTGSRPRVVLPQGTIVGITESGPYPGAVDCFKGIPFAQQPVGERRFRPPAKLELPLSPESVLIDASQFGPRAPAKRLIIQGPEVDESEECLTVNIFRPSSDEVDGNDNETAAKLLPVALYFHGGAFNRGNAAMHDTASLVGWSKSPFIGVSFGYRIGALGFLPSRLSAQEGLLNLGLKDQICLMEWIQDNISFFGGNKNEVTLFGLSAGAHSIGHHLLNYEDGVPPLFHRVIMESGAPTSRAVRNFDAPIHEEQFKRYLEEVGCPKGLSDSEVFPFLRSLPASVVTEAQTVVFGEYNPSLRWAFQPVIDGELIRGRPLDAWRNDRWHKMPIMTGFTTNEGSLYVDKQMSQSSQFTDFWRTLLPQLSEEDLKTINELYPDPLKMPECSKHKEERPSVGKMFKRIEAAYAHYAYVAPVRQTASFASKKVPVYLYHWALEGNVVDGARHGDNMWYETRDPRKCDLSEAQDALSGTLHAYITSFICTGSPDTIRDGYGDRPPWNAYDVRAPKIMIFGAKNKELVGGKVGPPAELEDDIWATEESEFWWSKVEISQQ